MTESSSQPWLKDLDDDWVEQPRGTLTDRTASELAGRHGSPSSPPGHHTRPLAHPTNSDSVVHRATHKSCPDSVSASSTDSVVHHHMPQRSRSDGPPKRVDKELFGSRNKLAKVFDPPKESGPSPTTPRRLAISAFKEAHGPMSRPAQAKDSGQKQNGLEGSVYSPDAPGSYHRQHNTARATPLIPEAHEESTLSDCCSRTYPGLTTSSALSSHALSPDTNSSFEAIPHEQFLEKEIYSGYTPVRRSPNGACTPSTQPGSPPGSEIAEGLRSSFSHVLPSGLPTGTPEHDPSENRMVYLEPSSCSFPDPLSPSPQGLRNIKPQGKRDSASPNPNPYHIPSDYLMHRQPMHLTTPVSASQQLSQDLLLHRQSPSPELLRRDGFTDSWEFKRCMQELRIMLAPRDPVARNNSSSETSAGMETSRAVFPAKEPSHRQPAVPASSYPPESGVARQRPTVETPQRHFGRGIYNEYRFRYPVKPSQESSQPTLVDDDQSGSPSPEYAPKVRSDLKNLKPQITCHGKRKLSGHSARSNASIGRNGNPIIPPHSPEMRPTGSRAARSGVKHVGPTRYPSSPVALRHPKRRRTLRQDEPLSGPCRDTIAQETSYAEPVPAVNEDFVAKESLPIRPRNRQPVAHESENYMLSNELPTMRTLDQHRPCSAPFQHGRSSGHDPSRPSTTESPRRPRSTALRNPYENIATLHPEQVAHLLPPQFGNMRFVPEKDKWVEIKPGNHEAQRLPLGINDDEDPLSNIPNLDVDEGTECRRTRAVSSRQHHPHGDELGISPSDTNSVPSKHSSQFSSMQTRAGTARTARTAGTAGTAGTRATSVSESAANCVGREEVIAGAPSFQSHRPVMKQSPAAAHHNDRSIIQHPSSGRKHIFRDSLPPYNLNSTPRTAHMSDIYSDPFFLSELPPFTVNGDDASESIISAFIQGNGNELVRVLRDKYAETTRYLERRLLEKHPDDRQWPKVRDIDLRNVNLLTLHRLNVCCPRAETVNVSGNQLSQISGLPYTVQRVTATNNSLSDITHWPDLPHMHFLDISDNNLTNLNGFTIQHGLTELIVCRNEIVSLKSSPVFDNLVDLNLSGNKLEAVHFQPGDFTSLTKLDLSNNKIQSVSSIHNLKALKFLNLADNRLEDFDTASETLESLTLDRNEITTLDASNFHALQVLAVDKNRLPSIDGIAELKYLDVLSARQQRVEAGSFNPSSFLANHNIKELYLSRNDMITFALPEAKVAGGKRPCMLKLQVLEIAYCKLESLPENFGRALPNLRILNLNFNGVRSLAPLVGNQKLEHLAVVGNALARLRKTLAVLSKMNIYELDLRQHIFNIAFDCSPMTENHEDRAKHLQRNDSNEVHTVHDTSSTDAPSMVPRPLQFVLSSRDADSDRAHLSHLSKDPVRCRETYDMLVGVACKHIVRLDGLDFERDKVMARGEIMKRLLSLRMLEKRLCVDGTESLCLGRVGEIS